MVWASATMRVARRSLRTYRPQLCSIIWTEVPQYFASPFKLVPDESSQAIKVCHVEYAFRGRMPSEWRQRNHIPFCLPVVGRLAVPRFGHHKSVIGFPSEATRLGGPLG